MLQWTRIQLPLSGPLDQASDAKIVDPTQRVSLLVNACYNKDGAISKAHGYEWISYTTPQYSAGVRAGEVLTHSMVSDGQRLYIGALHNVDPAVGPDYYAEDYYQAMSLGSNSVISGVGSWSPIKISQRNEYRTDSVISTSNTVSAGGYIWTLWNEASIAYYQVTDESSGVVIKGKTQLQAAVTTRVQIVAYGTHVIAFCQDGATTINAYLWTVTTPTTAPTTGVVTAAIDVSGYWDACSAVYWNGAAGFYVAVVVWPDAAGHLHKAAYTTNAAAPYHQEEDITVHVWPAPIGCCYHYDETEPVVGNKYILAVAYQADDGGLAGDIELRTYLLNTTDDMALDVMGTVENGAFTVGLEQLTVSTELGDSGGGPGSRVCVWMGCSRYDGTAAIKAILDVNPLSVHVDTILEAHTGGYEGNSISISMIGDSGAGVVITRAGLSFKISFEPGVSTRADVEAAITALAGADDLIDVKTAGTAAGAMTVADDSISSTLFSGGIDATVMTTYRVRATKVWRNPVGPVLTASDPSESFENYRISSRAVYCKGRSHCWLYYSSSEWPFLSLMTSNKYTNQWQSRMTEAITFQGNAVPRISGYLGSCWTSADATGYSTDAEVWMSAVKTDSTEMRSIVTVKADFGITGLKGANLGGITLVGGGQVCALDGRCIPHAFAHHPEINRSFLWSGSLAGGGLLEGATYKYMAVYEWMDANGLLHRSAPSLPTEVEIPYQGQLSDMATNVTANNQNLDWISVGTAPGTDDVVFWSTEQTCPLTIADYDTPQLMVAAINAQLDLIVGPACPFRILAGEPATFGGVVYNPTVKDRYEIILLNGFSAFVMLFQNGTHGATGTADSAVSLLGFSQFKDIGVAGQNLGYILRPYSPEEWSIATSIGENSFLFRDPAENSKVRLDVRTLITGDEFRNLMEVRIALFRTLANGSEYYLVDTYVNNTWAAWITINDIATDLSISEKRGPYTTGEPNDVLENAHPVGHILWTHGDRVWIVDNEDPKRVWVSKPIAVGVAPEFSYELQIVMPEEITAGLSINTHSLLFSERRCWAITGDGPNAMGVGDWLAPRLLSSDNGAVDHRSVCEIEGGCIAYGKRGLYAIQGGSVQPIGREVQDLMDGADVRAIINRRDDRQVWVCCEPANLGVGYVVVYDYERGRWYKLAWGDIVAAVEHSGLVYFGKQNLVGQEDTDGYVLGAIEETMQVSTGWLKVGGLAGYQRVRRVHLIGTWIGSCTAVVEVFYDYETTVGQTVTLPILTRPNPDMLARFVPLRQKCAAIKFKITVTSTVGATEKRGVDLHAVELEIGTKGSFRRAQISK